MSEDRSYNGWSNYETWAVGMFLDGNYTGEGTYREVLQLVENVTRERNSAGDQGEQPFYALHVADALKDYVEQEIHGDQAPASLATDLLGTALSEVDWRELADHKLSEVFPES